MGSGSDRGGGAAGGGGGEGFVNAGCIGAVLWGEAGIAGRHGEAIGLAKCGVWDDFNR